MSIAQLANLLVPILTTPWVFRALEPAGYGSYSLVTSISAYGSVFVNFGFGICATQRVIQIRDDREQLTRYFWTVQAARLLLAIVAIFISVILVVIVPKFRSLIWITIAYLPATVGTLLYPNWIFLGLEKMRTVATIEVSTRILVIPLIFAFVRTPRDVVKLALIWGGCSFIIGALATIAIFRSKTVGRCFAPSASEIYAAYRDAWPIFLTNISVTLYGASNPVVLGLVRDNYEVGIFTAAERVKTYSMAPFNPILSVFFPRVNRELPTDREKALKTITKVGFVLIVCLGSASTGLFIFAPEIIKIVSGTEFSAASSVLRIMAVLPLLEAFNMILASLSMLPLGMKRELSRIIMLGGALNIALLFPLGTLMGAIGAAMALTATNIAIVLGMGFVLWRAGFLQDLLRAGFARARRIPGA